MKNLTDDQKVKYTFLDIDDQLITDLINEIVEIGDQENNTSVIKGTATGYFSEGKCLSIFEKEIKTKLPIEIVKFVHIWSHILQGNDHVVPHNHLGMPDPENFLAFVFYLSAPEGAGELYFPAYDLELKPKNKMFVCFDMDVVHEVLPNHDPNILRISTAGNLRIFKN